jgi:hypothetical protein
MSKTKAGTKSKGSSTAKNPEIAKHADIRRTVGAGALALKPVVALDITYDEAMQNAKEYSAVGLQYLTAAVAMKDLTPTQLSKVHEAAAATFDAVEEAKKLARGRVLEAVLDKGTPVGSKGLSRELNLGLGLVQRVTIQKSGLDPKKFEAALRAKNVTVGRYMDTVTSFKLKEGTGSADMALSDGVFTADELKALEYEPSYRVDRPKEAKTGGEE